MKENEPKNDLKSLYNKYVLKGKGDPMKFSDFFTPSLFPFCKPSVASLYAANDAKITYELFKWQLPYCTEDNPKCKRAHLEAVSRLIWGVEFPLIKVCQKMHRTGMYLDMDIAKVIQKRYKTKREKEVEKLQSMVQEIIDSSSVPTSFNSRPPFVRGKDFNPNSPPHVKYLLYTLMGIPKGKSESTDKNFLNELNLPVTNQILKVRSLNVLINTFVDKMPNAVAPDGRIHAQFKQIGADTGRLSSAEPNMMNIPSHATDIRHMFRATASRYDIIDCFNDEYTDEIVVEIPRYYYVKTPEGERMVEDLKVGDSVILSDNEQEVVKFVKSIEDSSKSPGVCNVIF